MKKILILIFGILVSLIQTQAQKLDRSAKPKPGAAPEVKLGKIESFTLPNGLRVFVVENHKLPVLNINIDLDIKPELQVDMAGYQNLMSELLLGGTKTRSKDKLNEEIDFIGAELGGDGHSLYAEGLKKYQDKILELLSDIALNTDMKQDELDRAKEKEVSGLETQKNDPDAMVRNVLNVVDYGNKHPYGEIATDETVKKVTLDKCKKYYTTYFRPNVAYMAVVGDVTVAEIKPLIEKYFGSWEKKEVPVSTYVIPDLSGTKLTKVAFAPRVGAVQSVVSVTYPIDLQPNSPDVIKAKVANAILGVGSQGRLFLDLREKHAWTYGAYSSIKDDELGGMFSASVKCRNKVSDSSVQAILDEMKLMQTEKVSDTALQNSITYLSGNFSIGLEDPKRVAQLAIRTEKYHLPKDYYQNYLKNLSQVTADDVIEMSKKYIHPDHANIVVAGSKEDVAPKLAHFSADGKIDYYDGYGKPVQMEVMKPAPAGMTGDEVHKKYIAAMGGESAFMSIKDMKIVSTTEFQGMPLVVKEYKKAPNRWKQAYEMSNGGQTTVVSKVVFDGTKGFSEQMGQKQDLKGDDLNDLMETADWDFELHPEKHGISRNLKGIDNIDGKDVYLVEVVNSKGKKNSEYYDVASGLLVRKVVIVEGQKETATDVTDYKNYKDVPGGNGYKLPYEVVEQQGSQLQKSMVQSVEVNKGIADTEFN